MDIQVASNFERLLYDLCGRDGDQVRRLMAGFAQRGELSVSADALGHARELFDAASADEAETAATMAEVLRATGELVDPHTAVGIRVGRQCRLDPATPLVCLATAHPGKFPDAVRRATGVTPSLPAPLADLHQRAERFDVLPNDLCAVQNHIQRAVTAKA
jgi:threonine synthase